MSNKIHISLGITTYDYQPCSCAPEKTSVKSEEIGDRKKVGLEDSEFENTDEERERVEKEEKEKIVIGWVGVFENFLIGM
jgi:hypothetical protein